MSDLRELRANLRPLAAASLGVGTSLPLLAYTNTVFSPFLIKDLGWSRAQFALVGITMLATLVVLPFIGRFTDRFGVRKIALIGTMTMPLCFVAYSQMQGNFGVFLLIFTLVLIVGSLTGPLTYSRLIAENFDRSQGLALTIMNCVPAVLAIVLVPVLNWTIEHWGWRVSYLLLGGFILVCSIIAVALIPSRDAAMADASREGTAGAPPMSAKADYPMILKSKIFWIIVVGMFLCLLQTPLHAAQMNIMLMDNGLTAALASNVVQIYAAGTIVGRIACGLALDRYNTPIVTTVSMGIPAIGYFLLGTPLDTLGVIAFAMFLVGVSVGAESDLLSYLVGRYFKLRIFATTLGLLHAGSFGASAIGALLISLTLTLTDSFSVFLYFVAGAITLGSLMFMLLPAKRDVEKIG